MYFCSVDFCQLSLSPPLKYDTVFSVTESNYKCFFYFFLNTKSIIPFLVGDAEIM